MAKTKVIIAGAGIAGPVLAMFLKGTGYDPIIYERTESPTNHGLSLVYDFRSRSLALCRFS